MKKLCEEEKEQIKEMRMQGASLVEIAELYEVQTSALCKFFQKYGVRIPTTHEITGNMLTKEQFKDVFLCTDYEIGKWIEQGLPHERTKEKAKRLYKIMFDREQCHKWFRGEA